MPTILRSSGYQVVVRTDDHEPPHVHVFHAGREVVINLGDEITVPFIRDFRGMPGRNMRRALEIVLMNRDLCLREWRRIHG